jgi:hypothetical protein
MVGMLQILTYIFSIYLVIKGVEILQVALRCHPTGSSAAALLSLVPLR